MSDPLLESQWKEFQETFEIPEDAPTDEELKLAITTDLAKVCQMTVEEYTLYQKWCEIQYKYPTKEVYSLFGKKNVLVDHSQAEFITSIKENIWVPQSIDDYKNLKPELVYTDDSGVQNIQGLHGTVEIEKRRGNLAEVWTTIRNFISTMKNNNNIGRNLNYVAVDTVTGKYLGVVCISSDFLDLTPRDKFIGWGRTPKTQGHMINHTAIGSTIVPFQPLGYNYVGGKLLALLCLSDAVQNDWKRQYGDVLVGVTTTSLYGKNKIGGLSQYDGLKHWQKMGFSSGSVSYECSKETIGLILKWLAKNHTRKYFEWYHALKTTGQPYKRDHRNRSYTFVYSRLGIPKELVKSEHQRGIYFCPLYTNACNYLRNEVAETELVKAFDTSYTYLTDLWKNKYASKRIASLQTQGRTSSETLFYDDLIYLNWPETKEKYLGQVGR